MVASPEICRMNGAKSRGPVSDRGKAIASRNAVKHGLLAEKPPLLATEDLETFQGLLQNLVDDYQPEGAVEWHLVQTIAMCIQRQNRAWVAEAAIGNAEVLPPVAKPYTDDKYPALNQPQDNESWSAYHPTNLSRERELLTWFVEQNKQEFFPADRRSKYFDSFWQEWVESTVKDLRRLEGEYPIEGIPGKPDQTLALLDERNYAQLYSRWLLELLAANHPFAECKVYGQSLKGTHPPKTKRSLEDCASRHRRILGICQNRINQVEQIQQEIQQEQDRYQRDLAERQALTANPIPQAVILLNRYESHISKQLERAIAQLQNLQKERKNGASMGSFGQTFNPSTLRQENSSLAR